MGESLRAIFDEDAELYARARPGYPDALFADLAELAGVGPGARVVEIGPGTGQATRALVGLGARVVAVELGAKLAATLRRDLADAPVEVVVAPFEEWAGPDQPADAVVAFTAWHWLDPAVRGEKAAALLRPGGTLATVTTAHVRGGTAPFFDDAQRCYERWDPATPPGLLCLPSDQVDVALDEIDRSPLFAPAIRRCHHQDVTYSTGAYLDLLNTYSGHRALPADQRHGLFACIAALIDGAYDGTVTKRSRYELRVARRTDT